MRSMQLFAGTCLPSRTKTVTPIQKPLFVTCIPLGGSAISGSICKPASDNSPALGCQNPWLSDSDGLASGYCTTSLCDWACGVKGSSDARYPSKIHASNCEIPINSMPGSCATKYRLKSFPRRSLGEMVRRLSAIAESPFRIGLIFDTGL